MMRMRTSRGVIAMKETTGVTDAGRNAALDAAIGWHLRLRDAGVEDWEAFTAWLEADPAHHVAYDEVALADADVGPLLDSLPSPLTPSNDDQLVSYHRRRRWLVGGGAIAAVLVAGVVIVPQMGRDQRYEIVTAPGEQRVVQLGAQGRASLNGSTRLTLDRGDARFAALEAGEATFEIKHDAAHPFELRLGQDRVVDAGTVFNVVSDASGHRVEVSEGAVVYNPRKEAVALKAGQTLFDGTTADIVVRSRDPRAIGGWRHGRLDYRDATIAVVAADVSRSVGVPITVAAVLEQRPFTGTIMVDRNPDRMIARLAVLLDADVRHAGNGWTIDARTRAAH